MQNPVADDNDLAPGLVRRQYLADDEAVAVRVEREELQQNRRRDSCSSLPLPSRVDRANLRDEAMTIRAELENVADVPQKDILGIVVALRCGRQTDPPPSKELGDCLTPQRRTEPMAVVDHYPADDEVVVVLYFEVVDFSGGINFLDLLD